MKMSDLLFALLVALFGLLAPLVGCTQTLEDARSDHPAAIGRGLEVTVGPGDEGNGSGLVAARYVLQADGSLLAHVGETGMERSFPAFVRLLEPIERGELIDLGEAALAAGEAAGGAGTLGPWATEATPEGVRVVVHTGPEARVAVAGIDSPEARALVQRREREAWVGR